MTAEIQDFLKNYARRIRQLLRANLAAPETATAPAFQELVEQLLPLLPAVPKLTVVPEFNKPGVGRPDIALVRPGQPPRSFVELKAIAKDANPERWRDAHDKRQLERLKELTLWSTSNFAEFHLFSRGDKMGQASVVPAATLHPEASDKAADAAIAAHDPAPFLTLLATLARADAPAARNAAHLAELMAHSARLVRSTVQERIGELHRDATSANHPLMLVRNTFRNVLYAHPEAGGYTNADFDVLFSSAFAQTLAFGLLLVREAITGDVGVDAWRHMPDEHPLMKAALRVLSEDEVSREIGIGFTVMCDTVNSFAPEILARQKDGRDPILYFYEDFLSIFDPAARERYGVYYTPIEVVRYMAGALDRALKVNLGTLGLRDPAVTVLDPATGTGTFLLGIAERVRDQVTKDEGGIAASMALGDLAGRMFGFELLVGPYAVAHYRLHHALHYRPADDGEDAPQPVRLPRLGIYLADTLAPPGAVTPIGGLGIQGIPIDEERAQANRIKTQQPILAIIGNPPYKRLDEGENETLVGRWMDGLWDDLKKPVRDAGQGGQLNTFPEFSVAFWRWAIWKLFEAENAPQRGVIAFISNRKFLTGWPYAGLRQMMRRRFDRIEVIDLRGDLRAGPRGDVASDQGVFNIQVGTAITLAIADGSKAAGNLAAVSYLDAWQEGLFTRKSKLDWLATGAQDGALPHSLRVNRSDLDDWRPAPFQNGEWLSMRCCFCFASSGLESKRDHIVYSPVLAGLEQQIEIFLALDGEIADRHFNSTTMNRAVNAKATGFHQSLTRTASYRPLDRQLHYPHAYWNDRLRPDLARAWGSTNICLFSLPANTGFGPGAWCYGSYPDRHAFRGSYGGYAFPLYDRRAGPDTANIDPTLVAALSEAYGAAQTPQGVFDAILCLLSAESYTRRFAEDLEDVFPHIPFPADPAVFAQAVAIGSEIRRLEAFQREPGETFRPKSFVRLASQPNGVVASVTLRDGAIALGENGSGRITGIPDAVWSFAVSGYRVLPRWIEGRKGLPATLALIRELRDVAARIAELIDWFGKADIVLQATLANTLTREELGFPPQQRKERTSDD